MQARYMSSAPSPIRKQPFSLTKQIYIYIYFQNEDNNVNDTLMNDEIL